MFEVAASPHIILRRFQAILGKDAINLVIRHLVPPAFSIEGASRSSAVAGRRGGPFPHNETSFDVAPKGNDYVPPEALPLFRLSLAMVVSPGQNRGSLTTHGAVVAKRSWPSSVERSGS
jgi:hypothetical protein